MVGSDEPARGFSTKRFDRYFNYARRLDPEFCRVRYEIAEKYLYNIGIISEEQRKIWQLDMMNAEMTSDKIKACVLTLYELNHELDLMRIHHSKDVHLFPHKTYDVEDGATVGTELTIDDLEDDKLDFVKPAPFQVQLSGATMQYVVTTEVANQLGLKQEDTTFKSVQMHEAHWTHNGDDGLSECDDEFCDHSHGETEGPEYTSDGGRRSVYYIHGDDEEYEEGCEYEECPDYDEDYKEEDEDATDTEVEDEVAEGLKNVCWIANKREAERTGQRLDIAQIKKDADEYLEAYWIGNGQLGRGKGRRSTSEGKPRLSSRKGKGRVRRPKGKGRGRGKGTRGRTPTKKPYRDPTKSRKGRQRSDSGTRA